MNSEAIKISSIANPDISIVIPTYKRSDYVVDAINSAINQNNKTHVSYEIIVINNDPNADMSLLIRNFNFCDKLSFYKNEENYGQVGNINQGINLAKGKFVSILHDDDILLPEYLDAMHEYLLNPLYDCLIIPNYLLDKEYKFDLKHKFLNLIFFIRCFYRRKYVDVTLIKNAKSMRNTYGVPTCGMLFKKESLEKFGYFKDVAGAAWDYRNFRLFNKEFSMGIIHRYLAVRRIYTGMSNLDRIQQEFYNEKMEMIKENQDIKSLTRFGKAFIEKKPFFKFVTASLLSNSYFYFHNLDTTKAIPKNIFKQLKNRGYYI